MQIAYLLAAGIVGLELHWTDTGAHLALHLALTADVNVGECFGQRGFLRGYPTRDGPHGTERAPGARCIDEREGDTHDGGHEDDGPEHPAHVGPALGKAQLDAEHGEDEKDHEEAEAEGADELGDFTMGRVFREEPVVHVATGTHVATPPTAFPNAGEHRTEHTYQGKQTDDGIEPTDDEVGNDNPIER